MGKQIKWAALQPLTGGMYIGAENAIGHKAEFILSYPGVGDAHYNKNGEYRGCGNEYHLMKYLEKKNDLPNYMVFDKKQFEDGPVDDVKLLSTQWTQHEINPDVDYKDIDIVVAVPVCSGLSQATIGSDETKAARNCNMTWLTRYALGVIKPKIYVFENAPTLFSAKGSTVRIILDKIAKENGYSVAYYKTDTQLHDNAQRRPRTFCFFVKWTGNEQQVPPRLNWEEKRKTVLEVFEKITPESTQQIPVKEKPFDRMFINYFIHKLGADWPTKVGSWAYGYVIENNLFDDFNAFIRTQTQYSEEEREKLIKSSEHCRYKLSIGKSFYSMFPSVCGEISPAVMFKSIAAMYHPVEDRKLTVREYLTLMGHPQDFEMQGTDKMEYLNQIGQNVPARTAQWIVSEAVRIVNDWDNVIREGTSNIVYFDNIKQKSVYVA